MNCLTDFIGLSGCGASSPASGLFINSLPGISLKSVEQLADAEQGTYAGVWSDVQTRAQARLSMDVRAWLSKRYSIATGIRSVALNSFSAPDDGTITASDGVKFYGVMIDLDCLSSQFKSSALSEFTISGIAINYDESGYALKTIDPETGEDFAPASLNAINATYDNRKLFIGFNPTSTEHKNTPFETDVNRCDFCIKGGYWDGTTFTETSDNSYGVYLTVSVKCSIEPIICNNKDLFKLPYWYLLGSELMMERMVSERINQWTIDRNQAEELRAHYDAQYEKAIRQVCEGLTLNTSDACIECDPPIAIREAIL